jgi:CubicO group peptidase (beta-lactamase class C family)
MRLAFKLAVGLIVSVSMVGAGGYLWLRKSPYWAGITLFAEDKRVENFRSMDLVFPSRNVDAGDTVWAFEHAQSNLPETYEFEGSSRSLSVFLDETVTTGLLVVNGSAIAHEEYRLGADETSQFTSWSMAKAVLSALFGIALDEGYIDSLDDPITKYVPELIGSGYDGVTIEHALTMSSGVAFDEDYSNLASDVNRLFLTLAAGMPMEDTLSVLEREREPGTYNNYISADSIALGLVLEAATGMSSEHYLSSRLWQPMGAERDAYWSTGREGPVLAFCCLNATLRDYARFGRLFLNGGMREGEQIVPSAWVEASTRPTARHLEPGENPASFWTFGYGYKWWVPEDPQDEFLAIGIWGQYIYVDRAREVVIVKTSADYDFDTRDHESVEVFRAIASHFDAGST